LGEVRETQRQTIDRERVEIRRGLSCALLKKYADAEKEALEIGCRGGRIAATGVRLFKNVRAEDLSGEMLRKSRETVTSSNVSYHKLDGFALKGFSDSSLDFVYSHVVFVQLSSLQVYPYLMEIQRVLKKGGVPSIRNLCFPWSGLCGHERNGHYLIFGGQSQV
jgi:ubiquinone/menaquinone biosynthesis C-methylase UbiE